MREQDRQSNVSMEYAASVCHLLISRPGWNFWLYVIGPDSDENIVLTKIKIIVLVA
jgi:hypothetical protein